MSSNPVTRAMFFRWPIPPSPPRCSRVLQFRLPFHHASYTSASTLTKPNYHTRSRIYFGHNAEKRSLLLVQCIRRAFWQNIGLVGTIQCTFPTHIFWSSRSPTVRIIRICQCCYLEILWKWRSTGGLWRLFRVDTQFGLPHVRSVSGPS